MPPKRSSLIGLAWAASLLGILALVWLSGFLYWQVRIGRSVADLKRDARLYRNGSYFNPQLVALGTRAIPRLLDELDESESRRDPELSLALMSELVEIFNFARISDPEIYVKPSLHLPEADLYRMSRAFAPAWDWEKDHCPGWWMWWRGTRR